MDSDPVAPASIEPVEERQQETSDQQTNMNSQQESDEQRNADQPERMLITNCSIRNQLIASLNYLSTVLQSNKPIPEDARRRLGKKINDSTLLLMDLSPIEPAQFAEDSSVFEETIFSQLIVELSRSERLRIMNHLVAIKDALLFDSLPAGETKRRLIIESNQIISQLLDLPCRERSGIFCDLSSSQDTNREPSSKEQIVDFPSEGLKRKIEKLEARHGVDEGATNDLLGYGIRGRSKQTTSGPLFSGAATHPQFSTFGTSTATTGFGTSNILTSIFDRTSKNSHSPFSGNQFGTRSFTNPFTKTSTGLGGFSTVSNVVGTTIKFNPLLSTDVMVVNGRNQSISTRHQCIACMPEYENKSLEELRYESYQGEISFRFELADVPKFFVIDGNEHHSDRFWCRGLQWSVCVKCRFLHSDGSKHLGVFLHCHSDDLVMSCEVQYSLILVNQLLITKNLVHQFAHNFCQKKDSQVLRPAGLNFFINYDELVDQKNGYLKDDKIVLKVEMKAKPRGSFAKFVAD